MSDISCMVDTFHCSTFVNYMYGGMKNDLLAGRESIPASAGRNPFSYGHVFRAYPYPYDFLQRNP
ncbi:MAG: hypothetical protein ACI33P_09595, partial [Lysinibacillus sp.]